MLAFVASLRVHLTFACMCNCWRCSGCWVSKPSGRGFRKVYLVNMVKKKGPVGFVETWRFYVVKGKGAPRLGFPLHLAK